MAYFQFKLCIEYLKYVILSNGSNNMQYSAHLSDWPKWMGVGKHFS